MKKLIVLTAFLAGAAVTPAHALSCLGIRATSPQKNVLSKTFSATEIVDIHLNVQFADDTAGEHTLEVRIYTPKGRLYQSISVPVVLNQTGPSAARRLETYPELVAGAPVSLTTFSGQPAVSARVTLPVAGTPILNNSLYGTWTAEAFVDGDTEACGPRGAFVITQ